MDSQKLESSLLTLHANKDRWASLPISDKIDYLDQAIKRSVELAEEWALAGRRMGTSRY